MKRLTTDNPKDNIEAALNMFYAKGHEAWVRGVGPAPKYEDVRLFDFMREIIKTHLPYIDLDIDDDDLADMMADWLFDGPDSLDGVIATLYTAAFAFAELRHRLSAYEDTGLKPEEVNAVKHSLMGRAIAEIKEFEGVSVQRLQELAQAEKSGRLVVLPYPTGSTLLDRSNLERPELLANFRIAAAYNHRGIVFHQPFNIFMMKVKCGYISPLSEKTEAALKGGDG